MSTDSPKDNQCMLKISHINDHKMPPTNTDHKCKGDLDCVWCGGYWLKAFNRCQYKKVDVQIWVEFEEGG